MFSEHSQNLTEPLFKYICLFIKQCSIPFEFVKDLDQLHMRSPPPPPPKIPITENVNWHVSGIIFPPRDFLLFGLLLDSLIPTFLILQLVFPEDDCTFIWARSVPSYPEIISILPFFLSPALQYFSSYF